MTFPSNVRIISVPTGSNIGVASGGNAGASGQKVIASTGSAPTSQVRKERKKNDLILLLTIY